ncbi:uncharacterized protein PFL1_01615 [Pseudozyma flocculosa PF-1]|uniref:Related to SCS3 - protein required for inositol prototrophy n=1 Tax=Pseudozyma flocculosa TaxID=84751 RepID=A0A5C3F0Z0_9BASI|nr:uncharacterized protein PFL1_01615 [Pseudozyma flocculosa PF-1]EPQ30714.1 hypothetical protein PFL1_01615 [Pseudozyma flocculosa PF-1]SPO36941.1 related to SCS3 - protein required for inositol prototrophy [Pseudozyma flocculosa]
MSAATMRSPTTTTAPLPLGLQRYHVLFLGYFTAIVVLGTVYSILTGSHHANLHTTIANASLAAAGASPLSHTDSTTRLPPLPPTLVPPGHALAYWANRKNIFNQLFVKRAWFWTTLASALVTIVIRTRPGARIVGDSLGVDVDQRGNLKINDPRSQNRLDAQSKTTVTSPVAKSTLRWLMATGYWRDLFTSWFFGPPLTERILTATGGVCIPSAGLSGEVDAAYCRSRSTITSTSHPDLFSKLSLASSSSSSSSLPGGDAAMALKPLWRGGHDISGHTFLMVLSALFLLEEIAPFLPHLVPRGVADLFPRSGWSISNPFVVRVGPVGSSRKAGAGQEQEQHGRRQIDTAPTAVLAFVLAIVALWSWMLLMTAVYFHTPQEKITGLVVAIGCWLLLPKGG